MIVILDTTPIIPLLKVNQLKAVKQENIVWIS